MTAAWFCVVLMLCVRQSTTSVLDDKPVAEKSTLPVATCSDVTGDEPEPASNPATLFRAFDDALPLEVLRVLTRYGKETVKQTKLSTGWFETDSPGGNFPPPQTPIEQAIHLLRDIDFPGDSFARDNIVGAEWWFQFRDPGQSMHFHVDRDEGLHDAKRVLRHPVLSTVTYLGDFGAPTMVLNQTMTLSRSAGGELHPNLPSTAAMFFPKLGKHICFRGSLIHGVLGELASAHPLSTLEAERRTFLINWWTKRPAVGHAATVNHTVLGSVSADMAHTVTFEHTPAPQPVALTPLVNHVEMLSNQTMRIGLPTKQSLYVTLPNNIASANHLNVLLNMTAAKGHVGAIILMMQNRDVMARFFSSSLPKVVVFLSEEAELEALDRATAPELSLLHDRFLIHFAVGMRAVPAAQAFKLQPNDLPAIGLHNTVNDVKFARTFHGAPISPLDIVSFIKHYQEGQLRPLRQ
eukprot:m.381644 g.381644  ORF g.381644 m.381644 type:complete len:464 (+) comp20044_c1_seq1:42-1433(+)